MYTITGLSEAGPPLNLVESQHIIIHFFGYALLALLMIIAFPPETRRVIVVLLGLALLIGVGQETIQSIARRRLYLGPSLFDLGVDLSGAAVGLWLGPIFLSKVSRVGSRRVKGADR